MQRHHIWWIAILGGLGLILIIGAIGASAATDDVTLEGTTWRVTQLGGESPVGETILTARFEDGRISGDAGCNGFSGGYTTDGDTIEIGPLATTLIACPPPIDAQERAYTGALEQADRYEVGGETLTLFQGDETLVVYDGAPIDLIGSEWIVVGYNNGTGGFTSVVNGTEITMTIIEDGQISGTGSCNPYNAPYSVEDGTVAIGPVASGRMFCGEPEGTMEQETRYFELLQLVRTVEYNGNQLEMFGEDGLRLVSFNPA
jgi:heat shock protein HslJ